jgi:hypothetical protein
MITEDRLINRNLVELVNTEFISDTETTEDTVSNTGVTAASAVSSAAAEAAKASESLAKVLTPQSITNQTAQSIGKMNVFNNANINIINNGLIVGWMLIVLKENQI